MQMFRNMEVVLMLCFGLIVTVALLASPPSHLGQTSSRVDEAKIPVVVITAKRLSDAERARSSQEAG